MSVSWSTVAVLVALLVAVACGVTTGGVLSAAEVGTKGAEGDTVNARVAALTSASLDGRGIDGAVRTVAQAPANGGGLLEIAGMAPRQLFVAGYHAFDGPIHWAEHFAHRVLPCESKEWGTWYSNGFVTKAQFTHRSWRIATFETGLSDPGNPYHVGAAVAAWTNILLEEGSHPGSEAGWPGCF